MRARRRDRRFILSVPWEGVLRLPVDVVIESYTDREVLVLSTIPAHRDEVLTLDSIDSAPGDARRVRVEESVPVLVDGTVRHRLRLAIIGGQS
jgi:hypothetical protein